jgi:hypothetical protein
MSSSEPLRVRVSSPEYVEEHDAVVRVLNDFWESVTESDEFVGRLRDVSRFPQYLLRQSQ